jgi:hypothetical protein
MMSKIEKRLIVAALVFVAIYLGAAAITIHTRITTEDKIERLESPDLSPAEGQLLIAELFLPVMILMTLAINSGSRNCSKWKRRMTRRTWNQRLSESGKKSTVFVAAPKMFSISCLVSGRMSQEQRFKPNTKNKNTPCIHGLFFNEFSFQPSFFIVIFR